MEWTAQQDELILEEFRHAGMLASVHFADESGKAWARANTWQRHALALYKHAPVELKERMEEAAGEFLWSLHFATQTPMYAKL